MLRTLCLRDIPYCDEDQIVSVRFLDLAGSNSLALHYHDDLVSAIAKKLLPRLQALAAPDKNRRDLEEFWAHKITSCLGKNVKITQGRKTRSGKLTGSGTRDSRCGSNMPPGYFSCGFLDHGMWMFSLDIAELTRGHAHIFLDDNIEEKVDDKQFEEIWQG